MAIARVTKITALSPIGFQNAIEDGLTRTSNSLRGITDL